MRERIKRGLLGSWSRLFGYALSLTRDRDKAADVLQQSALKALASGQAPVEEKAMVAWLFKIVRNVWIDTCRHEAVRRKDQEVCEIQYALWTYDDRIIADLTVRQGLQRIDISYQEIIELVDIQGFRYAEAAEILGVAEGTVMSRLSRARLALLEAIGGNVVVLESAKRRTS